MNEDFAQYVWKFQKFSTTKLNTTTGATVRVVKVGTYNTNAGPDFLFGEVVIDDQLWAGTIEIHILSSDWFVHRHESDLNYDTVILHVVWEHDMEVHRSDGSCIPVLEIKNLVVPTVVKSYRSLFSKQQRWINCEPNMANVDPYVVKRWLDRLFFERLEQKGLAIEASLLRLQNNWEAALVELLAQAFGLKVNGASFLSIIQSLEYRTLRKLQLNCHDLESLFMGQAGWLEEENDPYQSSLKSSYDFFKSKFKLTNHLIIPPKFFRLRPHNFPTIRLSQLAAVLSANPSFFTEIVAAKTREDYAAFFNVKASSYWDTHYTYGVETKKSEKKLSQPFIDLLILNAIIPLKIVYARTVGKDISEEIIALAQSLRGESNTIVSKFQSIRKFENNAMISQSLLQLKNRYCDANRCLNCEIGNALLKR